MKQNKVCSKITVWVYLEGLEKEVGLIKKFGKEELEEECKKDDRYAYVYALLDWKKHREFQKKYEKTMVSNVKKLQKEVDKTIKGIEKGVLTEKEVYDYVFCMLTDFEARQFQGFDLLLVGKPIAPFVAPSLIEDFIRIPYNLETQLLWVCFDKYPEATREAIDLLKKNKKRILQTKEYRDILSKLGIKPKPLG